MSRRPSINSWRRFDRDIRLKGHKLLTRLDDFRDPVLVAGCQRSGTTALSQLITASNGMTPFQTGDDDELDAALILSGWLPCASEGRYCFQTTYLNNNYPEYIEHDNFKLVWVIRNPASVIYSMLHNWKSAALNRLFKHCGAALLDTDRDRWRYRYLGPLGIPKIKRACLSYKARLAELMFLREHLDSDRLLIVDYDRLTRQKAVVLPAIYDFIGLPYQHRYSDALHSGSIDKALSFHQSNQVIIDNYCLSAYEKAASLTRF